MSINAIGSIVPIYEYYYQINKNEEIKSKSPLADELKKHGITPSDDETLNIIMLKRAKEKENQEQASTEIASERPWADLMYQLNLSFNPDPKDDIRDIKKEIAKLTKGMDDEELSREIQDLESYAEKLYIEYQKNYNTSIDSSITLTQELSNISMLNKAML